MIQSECFSVQAIALFDLVERVLFEGGFDVVQNVIHMMFVWPPRIELWREVESSILMRDERVEDIRDKVYRWRSFGVIVGEFQTKL